MKNIKIKNQSTLYNPPEVLLIFESDVRNESSHPHSGDIERTSIPVLVTSS